MARLIEQFEKAIYFLSIGDSPADAQEFLAKSATSAIQEMGQLNNSLSWLKDTGAGICVASSEELKRDVGRLAFRLRRILLKILSTWIAPMRGKPDAATSKPSRGPLIYSDGPPPRQHMLGLIEYLRQINTTDLLCSVDVLAARSRYRFDPTQKQTLIFDTIRKRAGLTKEQLAAELGPRVDPSDLYPRDRWGLSELLDFGFVENIPGQGYVVAADLPRIRRKPSPRPPPTCPPVSPSALPPKLPPDEG